MRRIVWCRGLANIVGWMALGAAMVIGPLGMIVFAAGPVRLHGAGVLVLATTVALLGLAAMIIEAIIENRIATTVRKRIAVKGLTVKPFAAIGAHGPQERVEAISATSGQGLDRQVLDATESAR